MFLNTSNYVFFNGLIYLVILYYKIFIIIYYKIFIFIYYKILYYKNIKIIKNN